MFDRRILQQTDGLERRARERRREVEMQGEHQMATERRDRARRELTRRAIDNAMSAQLGVEVTEWQARYWETRRKVAR